MRALKSLGWVVGLGALLVLALPPTAGRAQDAPATQAEQPAVEELPPPPGTAVGEALPTEDRPAAPVEQEPIGFMVEWFRQGGVFMWPLLLCSVVGLAIVIERFWTLGRAHQNVTKLLGRVVGAMKAGGVQGGIEVCRQTRGPVAAVLQAGLLRAHQGPDAVEKAIEGAGTVELAFLQRGMVALATVVNVSPLLGFLGTVSGMIHAFEAIAAAEQVSAKLVASGIAEALITTEAGLCIAIPIQSAMNYFISRIDRFVLEMEEASIEIADTLAGMDANTRSKG